MCNICVTSSDVVGEATDDWAQRVWRRMDRDRDGFLTRQELACEEFYNIVRAAVAPRSGISTGGAAYSRTQVNVDAALELCLRKADVNKASRRHNHAFSLYIWSIGSMTYR